MAADNHNSWVEYDVAIAVIGKMIAEYNQLRDNCDPDIKCIIQDQDFIRDEYQDFQDFIRYTNRILELRNEINMIYKDQNVDYLLVKVENEYVPFLKERYGVLDKQRDKQAMSWIGRLLANSGS